MLQKINHIHSYGNYLALPVDENMVQRNATPLNDSDKLEDPGEKWHF